MGTGLDATGSASLFGVTFRRATVLGRFYLVYGTLFSLFLGTLLATVAGPSYGTSFPLFLPIFGVVGSMGALVVFTTDRTKGVLEYLMAYGFSPRRLFLNVLLTSLALVAIVTGVAVAGSLSVYLALGHPLTRTLALTLGLYGIPMAFACSAFAATAGMYWTALSSPRQGINSPIGLVPFIGILPALATLGVIIALGLNGDTSSATYLRVLAGGFAVLALVVIGLVRFMGRLLRFERFLSPA